MNSWLRDFYLRHPEYRGLKVARRSALYVAEMDLPRGVREFIPSFGAPFQNAFANPATVTPWYLKGGVALANCVAAYQPKGAASLAASYVNLAHPGTNDAAPGTAPTFNAATGWTFDGATQYLTTGIYPNSGWSVIVQYVSAAAALGSLAGCYATNKNVSLWPWFTGNVIAYENGGTVVSVSAQLLNGNLAVVGNKGYRNGVQEAATIGAWSGGAQTKDIYIGAGNNAGIGSGISDYKSVNIVALAIYSVTLTAPQVAAIYAAMALL